VIEDLVLHVFLSGKIVINKVTPVYAFELHLFFAWALEVIHEYRPGPLTPHGRPRYPINR